jgi:dTDP-4-dehydrorhamnose reductase
MQPILVTGGAGFIGSHTCEAVAAHGFHPIAFDNLSRGYRELVQWGPLVRGDILQPADLDRAFERYQPKSIIHFAALAYVGESVTQPLAYYQNNVSGLINVLDAMVRHGADTMVFSSSCATYGIPDALPIVENARQQPISPYGHYCAISTPVARIPMDNSASGTIPRHTLFRLPLMPQPDAIRRCRFSARIIRLRMEPANVISSTYPIWQAPMSQRFVTLTTAVKP